MDDLELIDIESSPEEEMLDELKRRGLIAKDKEMKDLTNAEFSILQSEVEREKRKSNPLENFKVIHNQYLEFTKQRRVSKVSDYYDSHRGGKK